ncbi:hypothetical protein F4782DRAFT_486006 [Xylaria castorea]|nr:hypothetical protein F4782DRAFT_486006 [Xylaria castorea]
MTERPPGHSLHDAAQSTTANALAITAITQTHEAPVATLATPWARSGDNGDNGDNTPTAVSQQPATLSRHPSPPLAPAPTSVRRLPNEERQPSQRHQWSPPPQPPQPPPLDFHPYYSVMSETTHNQFYDILRELDPYRNTPKEFIHLLVHAATRDEEIAQALVRLNNDRINNPSTWQPHLPPSFAAQPPLPVQFPSQPWPGTSSPVYETSNADASMSAAPPPAQEYATSLIHPRKRMRNEAAEQHAAPTPATSRFRVNCHRMVMFSGPQQPSPPSTHTGQPWNPTIVQVDAAAAQGLPRTPIPGQQGVPRPATTSTALPNVSAQSVAPTSDANDIDKVVKLINGNKKNSYVSATRTST